MDYEISREEIKERLRFQDLNYGDIFMKDHLLFIKIKSNSQWNSVSLHDGGLCYVDHTAVVSLYTKQVEFDRTAFVRYK